MHAPFAEIAALPLVGAPAGAIFVRLRQPVLIDYIAVGPAAFDMLLGSATKHVLTEGNADVRVSTVRNA